MRDAVTEEFIAFATVPVKGKSTSAISNAYGGFRIPQIFKAYGDTLKLSSLGYKTLELGNIDSSPETINLPRLDPDTYELQEAVVNAKKKKL